MQLTPVLEARVLVLNFAGNFHGQGRSVHFSRSLILPWPGRNYKKQLYCGMDFQKDIRLAVLIDADNVPYSNVKGVMEEITKYGTPTFKRIYGDWTRQTVSGWKNVLLENAITPIQQYSYTSGKNSSDSALIIDAMDILYSGKVDGFCIVSSDSDFTRLATRLREAGMKVFGIGQKKTPPAFIASCNKFIYLEILKEELQQASLKPTT